MVWDTCLVSAEMMRLALDVESAAEKEALLARIRQMESLIEGLLEGERYRMALTGPFGGMFGSGKTES